MSRLDKLREGGDVDEVLEEVIAARRAGTDPKDLFGGPRDWVDSLVPGLAFGLAFGIFHVGLSTAIRTAIGSWVVLILVRLVRRETLRHVVSGAIGLGFAALFAWKLGGKGFFLPGIVVNAAYGFGYIVSVLIGHPLVGVILRLILDRPKEWHEHPLVRRAYAEATLGWAGVSLLRVAVLGTLYRLDQVALLAVAKALMGYPLYIAALALTLPYVKWRTSSVPVPESADESADGEAEPGGGDAGEDAADGVRSGGGA